MPVTAPVSFRKIQQEFNPGNVPATFRQYRRGGSLVADNVNTANIQNTEVGLRLSSFLNASAVIPQTGTVSLTDQFSGGFAPSHSQGVVQASYALLSGGEAYVASSDMGTNYINGEWGVGINGNDYQVYASYGGSDMGPNSSPVNQWLSLGTTRSWTAEWSANFDGSVELSIGIQIRRVSDNVVMDNCTVTLLAQRGDIQ